MEFFTRNERERQLNELVIEACRMVGSRREVRSVHIVGHGRPTYAAMCKHREEALARHVRLAVDRLGTIAIRPDATEDKIRWH